VAVADAYTGISRDLLKDPWDRFIVATALVLRAPLVTPDGAIRNSELVQTVW
jgi:PIN domain nuclease of toxin-antitoxin system